MSNSLPASLKFVRGNTTFEISKSRDMLKISSQQNVYSQKITSVSFVIEDAKQLYYFLKKIMNNEYHRSKEQKYWSGKRAFFWLNDEKEPGPLCLQAYDYEEDDGSVNWIYLTERFSRDLFLFLNNNLTGISKV